MVQELQLFHKPVMLEEVISLLNPKTSGNYLDCTLGAGSYSKTILDFCNCNVLSIDRDPHVKPFADRLKSNYSNRFDFIETSFAESFDKLPFKKFDGIIMDLGVSSMQIDIGDRGFSFTYDGPLDMRMSNSGISAADFINSASEEEIAHVIYKYGDESFARKISREIVAQRRVEKINSTFKLASIIRSTIGFRKSKIDSATKTFQAIRIYVNDELGQLERFLSNIENIVKINGRIIIVSFHSLEDRIVKNFFKTNSMKIEARSKYSLKPIEEDAKKWLKILTKKPLYTSSVEVELNPRSRSARLRAGEKIC